MIKEVQGAFVLPWPDFFLQKGILHGAKLTSWESGQLREALKKNHCICEHASKQRERRTAKIWQIKGRGVDFDGQINQKIYEILS